MEDIDIIDFGGLKKAKKTDGTKKKKKKLEKNDNNQIEQKQEDLSENIEQAQLNVQQLQQNQEQIIQQQVLEKEDIIQQKEQEKHQFIDPFSYKELLDRILAQLQDKKPELAQKTKFIMKVPLVEKIQGKRSAWTNFVDICKIMKRNPEHVCQFFLAELGTEGSISENSLILKGKHISKNIEILIIKYIGEYVSCPQCKSPETILTRDKTTRLDQMKCNVCLQERTVNQIKTGFQALKQGERRRQIQKI